MQTRSCEDSSELNVSLCYERVPLEEPPLTRMVTQFLP